MKLEHADGSTVKYLVLLQEAQPTSLKVYLLYMRRDFFTRQGDDANISVS